MKKIKDSMKKKIFKFILNPWKETTNFMFKTNNLLNIDKVKQNWIRSIYLF